MKTAAPPRHLAWRVIEGRAYIVDSCSSTLHELDEVGTFIWQQLGTSSKDEIVRKIAREFDVTEETARGDLDTFLDELAARGLIEERKS